MLKLKCGTYNKVPILYCPYTLIKPRERSITYKIMVKKQEFWYSILPWHAPFHKWTWYDLCKNFQFENIELDEKAIKTFAHYETLSKNIENKVINDTFEFYTKPYPFQLEDFFRLIYWDRIPLFIECGLGKSKIVLDAVRHNKLHTLYLCPAPLVGNMIREAKLHARDDIQVVPLDIKWFQKFQKKMGFTSKDFETSKTETVPNWRNHTDKIKDYVNAEVNKLDKTQPILFLTTYSAMSGYADIVHDFFEYNAFVADESHKIKGNQSARTKAALKLADKATKRILMSGTASLGTPLDLFPQFKLLDETILGHDYFKFFRKFCESDPDYKWKAIGFKRLDKINDLIRPITIIQTKEECLPDLPERTQITYIAMLSKEEAEAYTDMSRIDWNKEEGDTFSFRGKELWVKQGSVKMLKMKQIASGFINMAQPKYELCDSCERMKYCAHEDISPNTSKCIVDSRPLKPDIQYMTEPGKLRLLKELLENILIGTNEKILVLAHFTAELNLIHKTIEDLKIACYRIDGTTKDSAEVADQATQHNGPAVLLAQISCGVGWNFVIANKVIYYSLDLQFESFAQSRDRVRRIGQKFNITEYHLHSDLTLDSLVKELIEDKEHIVKTLLSKGCSGCDRQGFCSLNNIEQWSAECQFSKEYNRPTLKLRIHEAKIHKLAMKMV